MGKTKKLIESECERESGREDFFLLLAFLIKKWRVNEIEREKEKGGLFGLGILWIIKIIHSFIQKGFQFHCFSFLFSFERESGKRKGKGESKKGEEGEMGERKEKKKRERKREERRDERISFERERNLNHQNKTKRKKVVIWLI